MRLAISFSAPVAMLMVGLTSPAASADDGPFGFAMGAVPAAFGCTPLKTVGMYECVTAPKPHSSFETYMVQATTETGICFVKGIGENVAVNSFGTSIRIETDKLAKQISLKYGKPELDDFLLPGSIWDDPQDWLKGLTKNERTYRYYWKSTSVENVEEVYLAAQALDDGTTYPVVEFYFSNYQKCESSTEKDEAGSF